MAHVRIVTKPKGTIIRNIDLTGQSVGAVDQAAVTLESIICEERAILEIQVDYEGCDDSKTVEGYHP